MTKLYLSDSGPADVVVVLAIVFMTWTASTSSSCTGRESWVRRDSVTVSRWSIPGTKPLIRRVSLLLNCSASFVDTTRSFNCLSQTLVHAVPPWRPPSPCEQSLQRDQTVFYVRDPGLHLSNELPDFVTQYHHGGLHRLVNNRFDVRCSQHVAHRLAFLSSLFVFRHIKIFCRIQISFQVLI